MVHSTLLSRANAITKKGNFEGMTTATQQGMERSRQMNVTHSVPTWSANQPAIGGAAKYVSHFSAHAS